MRVLVTRAEPEAHDTAARLVARGHEAVVAPMLHIRTLPAALDVAGAQALAVTSANGARAAAAATAERGLPLFAVGDASAAAARALGFSAVQSADGDVEALAALIAATCDPRLGPIVHARGRDAAGDLAGRLETRGFSVRAITLYVAEQACALPAHAAAALRAGTLGATLLHSARGAAALARLLAEAGLQRCAEPMLAACLSRAAAVPAQHLPWRAIAVAAHPREDELLRLLNAEG